MEIKVAGNSPAGARLGEDPVQQNRQEVEKGECGGEKNPDPPGISEQNSINKRIVMYPVLL